MRGARHPVSQVARDRLREAQRLEAQALTAVEKAAARRDQAVARLAAAQVAPQRRLDEAERELTRARAGLADVSGVDRAATLLGESTAQVRAAIRSVLRLAKDQAEVDDAQQSMQSDSGPADPESLGESGTPIP